MLLAASLLSPPELSASNELTLCCKQQQVCPCKAFLLLLLLMLSLLLLLLLLLRMRCTAADNAATLLYSFLLQLTVSNPLQ